MLASRRAARAEVLSLSGWACLFRLAAASAALWRMLARELWRALPGERVGEPCGGVRGEVVVQNAHTCGQCKMHSHSSL